MHEIEESGLKRNVFASCFTRPGNPGGNHCNELQVAKKNRFGFSHEASGKRRRNHFCIGKETFPKGKERPRDRKILIQNETQERSKNTSAAFRPVSVYAAKTLLPTSAILHAAKYGLVRNIFKMKIVLL
jgi:hypothetical protein